MSDLIDGLLGAAVAAVTCNRCGKTYTPEEWARLELKGYVGHWKSGGKLYAVEIRNCSGTYHGAPLDRAYAAPCNSTLGVEVENPPMTGKEEVIET